MNDKNCKGDYEKGAVVGLIVGTFVTWMVMV